MRYGGRMSFLAALLIALAPPVPGTPPGPMREINVTNDSAPGWLPSEAGERGARTALDQYFAAVEAGDDRRAYAMMTPGFQAILPFADFAADNARFRTLAGPLSRRRVLRLTWTKDPADAPRPGIYAAFDVAGEYANVDRQCGYAILYQETETAPFRIARIESTFMSNADAQDIERTNGRAAVDQAWAAASQVCPNYRPAP
jgi:hypothetical protein